MRYRIEWLEHITGSWHEYGTYKHFFFLNSAKKEIFKSWKQFDGCNTWWVFDWRIIRRKDSRVMCEISIKERK